MPPGAPAIRSLANGGLPEARKYMRAPTRQLGRRELHARSGSLRRVHDMTTMTKLASALLVLPTAAGLSQRCAEHPDLPALTEQISRVFQAESEYRSTSFDQDIVYRACAVAGDDLRPALQRITDAWKSRGGVPAAARVCLARLGDTASFSSLRRELDTVRYANAALEHLIQVGTRSSTSVVLDFMERKQADTSRIIYTTDAADDPIIFALNHLAREIPSGPQFSYGRDPLPAIIRRWRDWWASDPANGQVLEIEKQVPNDPYMRCLARKAEWGFSGAVVDLSIRDTAHALTGLFRELADKDPRLSSTARTILAERGDEAEFERIAAALSTSQYSDAMASLEDIGTLRSVGALVRALDLDGFYLDMKGTKLYDLEARRYWSRAFGVLARMVNVPPVSATAPPNKENVARWKAWWANGPTPDALVPPRRFLSE
jgi:hypothetical protein